VNDKPLRIVLGRPLTAPVLPTAGPWNEDFMHPLGELAGGPTTARGGWMGLPRAIASGFFRWLASHGSRMIGERKDFITR